MAVIGNEVVDDCVVVDKGNLSPLNAITSWPVSSSISGISVVVLTITPLDIVAGEVVKKRILALLVVVEGTLFVDKGGKTVVVVLAANAKANLRLLPLNDDLGVVAKKLAVVLKGRLAVSSDEIFDC